MTDQELEQLATEFIHQFASFQREDERRRGPSFERRPFCQQLIDQGLVCQHAHLRPGDYTIHHRYTGTALFTGRRELAFTEKGLPLAEKICDIYRQKHNSDMKVIKDVYYSVVLDKYIM